MWALRENPFLDLERIVLRFDQHVVDIALAQQCVLSCPSEDGQSHALDAGASVSAPSIDDAVPRFLAKRERQARYENVEPRPPQV